MTVKSSSVIITHGHTEKLHMEAYSLFFYLKHSNIYKTKYTLTAEAGEPCSKARVLTKLWKTVNKQPKQPKSMRVFQAATTNPYYPIRVCIRWNNHGKTRAYRGLLSPQPRTHCADREERQVVPAHSPCLIVRYIIKGKEFYKLGNVQWNNKKMSEFFSYL